MPEWIVKYWVEWVFGLIIAILGGCFKHLSNKFKKERAERLEKAKRDEEEIKALKNGMRSLLRRQIIADCEAAQGEEYCDMTTKDTIKDMYDSYAALGGNGIVKIMVEQVTKLPTFKLTGKENHYEPD